MTLIKVWDKEGVMHEVDNLNAYDLVRHCGWSRKPALAADTQVAPVEPTAPAVTTSSEPALLPQREEGELPQPALALEAMSKSELAVVAKEKGVTVEDGWSKARLIAAINS